MAQITIQISAKDQTGAVLKSLEKQFQQHARNQVKAWSSATKAMVKLTRTMAKQLNNIFKTVIKSVFSLKGAIATLAGGFGITKAVKSAAQLDFALKQLAQRLGTTIENARLYAFQLINAAQGTLSFQRAVEIANRAIPFIPFDKLALTMEFISKKAIAAGLQFEVSFDKVITGLLRGSVLLLDDFQILLGGIKGVKAEFDKAFGPGSWNALGEHAQKMEVVRVAWKEMEEQMEVMKVSGMELALTLNAIVPAMQNIAAAFGGWIIQTKQFEKMEKLLRGFTNFGRLINILPKEKISAIFNFIIEHLGRIWEAYKKDVSNFVLGLVDLTISKLKVGFYAIAREFALRLPKGFPTFGKGQLRTRKRHSLSESPGVVLAALGLSNATTRALVTGTRLIANLYGRLLGATRVPEVPTARETIETLAKEFGFAPAGIYSKRIREEQQRQKNIWKGMGYTETGKATSNFLEGLLAITTGEMKKAPLPTDLKRRRQIEGLKELGRQFGTIGGGIGGTLSSILGVGAPQAKDAREKAIAARLGMVGQALPYVLAFGLAAKGGPLTRRTRDPSRLFATTRGIFGQSADAFLSDVRKDLEERKKIGDKIGRHKIAEVIRRTRRAIRTGDQGLLEQAVTMYKDLTNKEQEAKNIRMQMRELLKGSITTEEQILAGQRRLNEIAKEKAELWRN